MKTKTINRVINKKFDEWLASIEDESVRKLVEKNTICTGGCIASMLLQEKVNDFDFYFRNMETAHAVAKHYVSKHERKKDFEIKRHEDRIEVILHGVADAEKDFADQDDSGSSNEAAALEKEILEDAQALADEEKPKYIPVYITNNAISLSGSVQMVIRFIGEPDEIHKNYDFAHATNYWTSWERKVTLRPEALECLLTRELRYIGSKFPICSLIRIRKFVERRFTINAGQILKICLQIHALDLMNVNVLREQLAGVDVAYFGEVLDALAKKNPEEITASYLVEILDRIFG